MTQFKLARDRPLVAGPARNLMQLARSRYAVCLAATLVVLGLGSGLVLLHTVSIVMEAHKIAREDAALIEICADLQADHHDREALLADLLRMSTSVGNSDPLDWSDRVALFQEIGQHLNQSLAQADQILRRRAGQRLEVDTLLNHLLILREKDDQFAAEVATLIRLANEGRVDEVRALGPYARRAAEVIRARTAALCEIFLLSITQSTRAIESYATQLMASWLVISGLLVVGGAWMIGAAAKQDWDATHPSQQYTTFSNDSARRKALPLGDCRVVLAEDGASNQRLIATVLRTAGARVELANDGQEALDKVNELRDLGKTPDVVITDIQMPIMDGLQLMRKLRDSGFQGKIIALTAQISDATRQKCGDVGCDAFLPKPIRREDLIGTLVQQLSRQPIGRG